MENDSLQRIVAEMRSESAYVGERLNTRLKVWADRLERLSAAEQKVTEEMYQAAEDAYMEAEAGWPVYEVPLRAALEAALRAACESQKSDVGVDGVKCQCRTCIRARKEMVAGMPRECTMMILCPTCGNKRCPHANDHRNKCTNSNDTGQEGSAYQ